MNAVDEVGASDGRPRVVRAVPNGTVRHAKQPRAAARRSASAASRSGARCSSVSRLRGGQLPRADIGDPLPELRAVLGVADNQLSDELVILKNHSLADVDLDGTEESLGAAVVLAVLRIKGVDGYVRDLKAVSEATGISLERPIVRLDFRLLDNG